jgi:hypothetical protein
MPLRRKRGFFQRPTNSSGVNAHWEVDDSMATRAYDMDAAGADEYDDVRGMGWIAFAGIMLGLAGTWSIIDGILAISRSKVYGVNHTYVWTDLRTWGWIMLVLGCLLLLATFAIFAGSEFARWFGMIVAGLNAIGQLGFVSVYPFWALMLFTVDILVIYALAVYGGKKLREA